MRFLELYVFLRSGLILLLGALLIFVETDLRQLKDLKKAQSLDFR